MNRSAPAAAASRVRDVPAPRRASAGRVLFVAIVAGSVWLLLSAPSLQRSAESSPFGARRTVALAVLDPLSRLSRTLHMGGVGRTLDRALGRVPPPAPALIVDDDPWPEESLPAHAPKATAPLPPAQPFTPPGELSPLRRPTRAHPLRVLAVGDSLAEGTDQSLARILTATGVLMPAVNTQISTGLARPDFFDWPARLRADIHRFRPDVVVVMFGANDNQAMVADGQELAFGTAAWRAEYARRVRRIIAEAVSGGRRLIWVGVPVVAPPSLAADLRLMNGIYRSAAARSPAVTYVDGWRLFADGRGRYTAYRSLPGGGTQLMRAPDGVHMTLEGYNLLAGEVYRAIRSLWRPRAP